MKKIQTLLLILFCGLQAMAQQATPLYYKVYFEADAAQFKKLNTQIAFEHLARSDKGFVGDFNTEEKNILLAQASNAKVLIADVSKYYAQRAKAELDKPIKKTRAAGVPANYHGGSMGGFMTLSQIQLNLDSMNLLYPALISAKQLLGYTAGNRPIYCYKISDNHAMNEAQEHKTLYTALHHAREPQSAAQLIYYMWYLLENYNTSDSVIRHLVDDREMYFIPVLNPDGYAYNEQTDPAGGGMWRKNRRDNLDATYGVDLNRNYAKFWAFDNIGSSPNTSSDTYRGPSGFSEEETQIMQTFSSSIPFKICLNYHSYGDWFIYPWGYDNLTCPDDTLFQVLADFLTKENLYVSGNCFQTLNYYSNGCSDDWLYGEQVSKPKIFAITPEVGDAGDGFWPSPSNIIPLCQENLLQNIMAAWMSGPYMESKRIGTYVFTNPNVSLQFNFKNYGLDTSLQLKSWFVSSNPLIAQNNDTIILNNLSTQQSGNGSLNITMQNNTPNNTLVNGRLYTKYNNFVFSDTASFLVKSAVGIEVFSQNNSGFNIHPNPGNGIYLVQSNLKLLNAVCTVKDIEGKLVSIQEGINGNNFMIDIAAFAKGVYMATIQSGNKSETIRLVKY